MKKKLVLLCMAGVIVFGLSACGSKQTASEQTTATEAEEGTQSDTDGIQTGEEAESESSEIERVADREDYVGLQDLDIDEYVTLMDYKNMEVSVERTYVSDEEIEEYINSEILVGSITNRAVQEGDVADIDFEGKKDGVAFDGGTAEGYMLTIGSGSFIPGFEDGLIGVMPGETVDLDLTFPETYQNEELAGQQVVFTVTVNSIQGSAQYADVTVEEMASMGLTYKTKEEVWEAGKAALEDSAAETFAASSKSAIVQKLVEESTVSSIPDYLVEEEVQNYNLYMANLAQGMYGIDLETFITGVYGMTMDEYNEELNEMCTETIKQYMVMEAVARAEGIEVTDEMIQESAQEEAILYGYESGEALIDDVGFSTYRMSILQNEVMTRLLELVEVEEQTVEEDTAQ